MRNAAGGFEQRPAVRDAHRLFHGIAVHIVEHDDIGFRIKRLLQFVERPHLNLNPYHVPDL